MSRCFSQVVIVSFVACMPVSTPIYAQSCEQELARQDAALRQLDVDARREGVSFLVDDVRHAALGEVGKRLRGDPTADAAREIKARWDEYQAYVNQGKTFQTVAAQLSQCLQAGQSGCLAEIKESVRRHTEASRLADRIGEAVQKWIESLGNEAISRAAERVDRARNIMENFTNRAANTAIQSATQGINSCFRDFDRRVQQAQNTPAVDTRQPPSRGASAPKKGMSGAKVAALIGIPAAAAVVLGTYAQSVGDAAEANDGGSSGGSSSSQIRLVNTNATIQCAPVGGASLQSVCVGDIILDVANAFSAGSQVCIRTYPSALLDCKIKGSSSELAFRIDERIINLDFNGTVTGCRPVQTEIFVYNGSPNSAPATARVSANIPVTCRQ